MNRRAFVLGAVLVALCSVVAVSLRAFAEAAFLGAYGARQMPWLPIANAAGFAVATLGYDALVRVARASVVDIWLLVALGAAAAAAPALLAAGAPPVVLVVALAATSQVAGLALWNRVAATVAGRDARRMLPRAGAAVTAGGAVAGLAAGAWIARLGLSALPYAAAAVTAGVLVLCTVQERALARGGAPGVGAIATAAPTTLAPVQRRLLAALVVVAVLEAIVATVVDLQFLAQLRGRFTGDDVAVALALFYGGTNAVLFALQVVAAPRLLVTRSLTFTAAIHPALVIASYLGFAAAPGFFAIAGTRTADQVLHLATSRTSQELALSALPPEPRARWKVLLRGALWPLGAAAAGVVLLAIGPRAPGALAAAAIAIAAVWAIAARVAARRFQTALAAPLGIRAATREDPRRIDLDTLRRWTHVAGGQDARHAALAHAALARARVDVADLGEHLRDDEPEVRAAMYEQLAREPAGLVAELRAAIAIEDDDRALALAIKALALHGDASGIARGTARGGLSREVDDAVAVAKRLVGEPAASAGLGELCERDPRWAVEVARRGGGDQVLVAAAAEPARRDGALRAIANVPSADTLPILVDALAAGEPAARAAIEALDATGARALAASIDSIPPLARAALARALAGAIHGAPVVAALIDDRDPEVAHAALRTAVAIGRELPAARVAAARDAALAALVAHLDTRDGSASWSACARAELEVATRSCVARVLWTAAVEATHAGRDPAPLAAAARHLTGERDANRRRALDVVQELQAGAAAVAAIERWLQAPRDAGAAAACDPWLARLVAGELAAIEPALVALRRSALLASIAGPALAELAARAHHHHVASELFRLGEPGDEMYVVVDGALIARRADRPDRPIAAGDVVGELAVLTRAPRAATVAAEAGGASVLAIDRAAFATAARRAPELVLGLASTLASWLAPDRPDVL